MRKPHIYLEDDRHLGVRWVARLLRTRTERRLFQDDRERLAAARDWCAARNKREKRGVYA